MKWGLLRSILSKLVEYSTLSNPIFQRHWNPARQTEPKPINIPKTTLTAFLLMLFFQAFAQEPVALLSKIPKTKEEFIESEKHVLATIAWMENTPINEQKDKHTEQYGILMSWLTNSPTVTIELNTLVMKYTQKNEAMLIFFLAGWTKYALENDYSKDVLHGTSAGLRCVMRIYQKGGLEKDKQIQKLISLEEKGKLKDWVAGQLAPE
ncbi:hypothetical protein [Pontibacter sp. G13]|uniref:hypothetical protein n=1 Tax=Pontibacter sp. G13 TaxID=3074898 RepID=UPI00288B0B1F|nr:hypothetical protein [Pontibacter sp. G13]WNJ20505.1 hypothetical protein RJD25_08485 [Pontibacter sp. G13]